MEATPSTEGELREQAITRLKKKRDFRSHVFIYVAVIRREAERLRGTGGM